MLTLNGDSLDCEQLVLASTLKTTVTVDDIAWGRVKASRKVVNHWVDENRPAYGITTGVGSQKDFALGTDQITHFNRQLVRAHATHATGPCLSPQQVRAVMIILTNGFAKGYSGISEQLLALIANNRSMEMHLLRKIRCQQHGQQYC